MFAYLWFQDAGSNAEQAIRQFQNYMRTRNEMEAPLLFDRIRAPLSNEDREHPFELVLRFAHGYRDIIIADNARLDTELPDQGRWTLDLSTSGLWSHLNHWGRRGRPLTIRCDISKPLQASVERFAGNENDPAIRRARLMGRKEALGWTQTGPVTFVDSRDHPAVQLADVIAGTLVGCLTNGPPEGFDDTMERLQRHILPDTILPDFDVVDLEQRAPAVNYLMLYDLAQRAERGQNPYANLAEMYHAAEVSWVRGDFHALRESAHPRE